MKKKNVLLVMPLALTLANLKSMNSDRRVAVASSSSSSSSASSNRLTSITRNAWRHIETIDLTTIAPNDPAFGRIKREKWEQDHSAASTETAITLVAELTALENNPHIQGIREWKSAVERTKRYLFFDKIVPAYENDYEKANQACGGLAQELVLEKQLGNDLSQSIILISQLDAHRKALDVNRQANGTVSHQLAEQQKIKADWELQLAEAEKNKKAIEEQLAFQKTEEAKLLRQKRLIESAEQLIKTEEQKKQEARQTLLNDFEKRIDGLESSVGEMQKELDALYIKKTEGTDPQVPQQIVELEAKIKKANSEKEKYEKRKQRLAQGESLLEPTATVSNPKSDSVTTQSQVSTLWWLISGGWLRSTKPTDTKK